MDFIVFVGFTGSQIHSLQACDRFRSADFIPWDAARDENAIRTKQSIVCFITVDTPFSLFFDIRRKYSEKNFLCVTDDPKLFIERRNDIPELSLVDASWEVDLQRDVIENLYITSCETSSRLNSASGRMELIRALIHEIPNPVFIKDEDRTFLACNPAFVQFCGLPYERIIGFTNADVFPPDSARKLDEMDDMLSQNQAVPPLDLCVVNRNRIEWDIHLSESSFEFMGKRRFLGVIVDMSQQKEVQERLKCAIESAKRANESRTLFLSHITHEIRTPINSMLGILTLLKDTVLDPVQEDYLNILQINGNALLTIINDLLDFSKIEAGKLEIEHRPLSLHTCVEDALKVVDQTADEKRIELAYYIKQDTPRVINSDMDRIRQILLNLLSNAIKFTTIGYIYIYVDSTEIPDGKTEIHFQVQDTGSGIEQDKIERIFMAFNQADSSVFKHHGGTGLGLTICRQLSELLGGRIWVESEVGKGSTFHFTIVTEAQEDEGDEARLPFRKALNGKRLLGIGSDYTMRKIIPLYTQYWNMEYHRVDYTMNMNDIREMLAQSDAVVMSVPLFGSRNLGLLHRIRLEFKRDRLPMMILGSRNQIQAIRGDAAADEALTAEKPLKEKNFYHALARAFNLDLEKEKEIADIFDQKANLAEIYPTRILVCDDNIFEQKIIGNYLGKLGYHADIASTGEEALQIVRRHKYDLLIIDMNLPGRDGVEIAEEIKTTFPVEHQPRIVVSTSYDYRDIKDRLDRAGVDSFLGKPFHIEDLVTLLTHSNLETEKSEKPMIERDDKLIDFERLEKELLPLEEEMIDVIGTYLDQVEVLINGMRNANENRNLADLNRFAHSLKSNSLSLGIIGIGAISERIEQRSENDFDPGIPQWIDTIEERFIDIREMLTNKYLK